MDSKLNVAATMTGVKIEKGEMPKVEEIVLKLLEDDEQSQDMFQRILSGTFSVKV